MFPLDEIAALGAKATGARLERMQRSPQFREGVFHNQMATTLFSPVKSNRTMWDFIKYDPARYPQNPLPLQKLVLQDFQDAPASGLRVTWLGHATILLEIDGYRLLLDPVFSKRVSPFQWLGPKRFHEPPLPITDVPVCDAILISHDHYDHMDMLALKRLAKSERQTKTRFIVPLGAGAHLEYWGIAAERISELDWHESVELGSLKFVAEKARHFSGRSFNRNTTLWCSFAILGPTHRVFYSGDSGYFPGYTEIGQKHGPFDFSIFGIGAYDPAWQGVHFTPEEAIQAHRDLGAKVLLPVHWGTFNLAFHPWTEPAERVIAAAALYDVKLVMPRPGEMLEPMAVPQFQPWWRDV